MIQVLAGTIVASTVVQALWRPQRLAEAFSFIVSREALLSLMLVIARVLSHSPRGNAMFFILSFSVRVCSAHRVGASKSGDGGGVPGFGRQMEDASLEGRFILIFGGKYASGFVWS